MGDWICRFDSSFVHRLPSKLLKAMPRQRSIGYLTGEPVRTRMTTEVLCLISPIWPSSTLSVKPLISEG